MVETIIKVIIKIWWRFSLLWKILKVKKQFTYKILKYIIYSSYTQPPSIGITNIREIFSARYKLFFSELYSFKSTKNKNTNKSVHKI